MLEFLSVLFVTSHQFHYSFLFLLSTKFLTSFPLSILLETISSSGPHKYLPDLRKCHLYLHSCLWVKYQAPNHFSMCLQWLADVDMHPLWAMHRKCNVELHLLLEGPLAWIITQIPANVCREDTKFVPLNGLWEFYTVCHSCRLPHETFCFVPMPRMLGQH